MLMPTVTETLPALRRELERVRRSRVAVMERSQTAGEPDRRRDLPQRIAPRLTTDQHDKTW
jgi:hypothetical protein